MQAVDGESQEHKGRWRRFIGPLALGIVMLLSVLGAAFGTYSASLRSGMAQIDDMAIHQLDLYASTLESELARYADLPGLLEVDRDIQSLFEGDRRPQARAAANRKLASFNVMASSMAIFLVDPRGAVLASSDAYRGDASAEVRTMPLFLAQALRDGKTGFFAADPFTGMADYYFAQRVEREGRFLGLIGVQISLDPLEATWVAMSLRSQSEEILVIDDNGVVIMTSVPQWKYRTISLLTPAERQVLEASGQYPPQTIEPLGMKVLKVLDRGVSMVQLPESKGEPKATPRSAQERPLSQFGWRFMIVSDLSEVANDAVFAAWSGGAIAGFFCLLALYLLQRRRAMRQLFDARNALQQANDTLEAAVVQRTSELRAANDTLIGEMQERQRAEEELLQAGKLAVLGQMSVGVAHEINQPLTALRALSTNTALLLNKGRIPEAVDNLKAIGDVAARMGRITAQLKSFARKTHVLHSAVSPRAAIANVCVLLEHRTTAEQVQVKVDVAEDLRVLCDLNRLEQVLINLATNAIDAMAGAEVRVLSISAHLCGDRLCLRVADTGPEVPDAVMARMFEPFFSTKPAGEGLGLGLVISSSIVREFGGKLRVGKAESALFFEFDLPIPKGAGNV
ncbi:MAG: sensor histidine kinase [Burkholderiales bacterium]|nr:sensor histidine kinase [Burkholderiales bacterium]